MKSNDVQIGLVDGGAVAVRSAFRDRRGFGFATAEARFGKTAVLLNNTAAYHGYRHFGTNSVTGVILGELERRGISTIAYANNLRGAAALCDGLKTRPSLVVLNGEGTMHNNHERAIGLLLAATHFKKWGVPCALINSLWDRNTSLMAFYLNTFDYISVRDSVSKEAISKATPADVSVVPDLSLAVAGDAVAEPTCTVRLGVADSADEKDCKVIRSFADRFALPFYTMEGPSRAVEQDRTETHATAVSLEDCDSWITGRYHFALAALCMGKRFLAVRTRVSKMQGMLVDAGLSDFLLDDAWLQAGSEDQMTAVREKMSAWDDAALLRAASYRSDARRQIAIAFDRIASLAG
jgi:hypothetical protein